MNLRQGLIAYGATAVVFFALDAAWLATMSERLYRPALGHLMAERFSLAPAAVFYPLYLVGVFVFAVMPALEGSGWPGALWRGALLGLVAYATYDLTNQATLRNWPVAVTAADLCWGTFVTAVAAAAGCWLTERIERALS